MLALEAIVAVLAPDHAEHLRDYNKKTPTLFVPGTDVQVMCSCSVRLTFLAAQISAITPPPQTTSSPKTKAGG